MTVDKETTQCIDECKEVYLAPDGKEHTVIGLKAVNSVARSRGIMPIQIEVAALEQGIIPRRYLRNMGTIGWEGQIKLLRSTVAVVGAGGLGGTVVELLARHGIGRIIVIDGDRFTEDNLNRQLLSTEENLGEYKAIIAVKRVKEINSSVSIISYTEELTGENAHELIKEAQVVVDGLDNLPSRFVVEKACRDSRIPFVHGTIAGFNGQLMTIFPQDMGLCSIYGEPHNVPERGIEAATGNPSATPTMIAAWQVQEVVKIITGIGRPLRNRLLMLDAIEGIAEEIELGR